MYSFTFRDISDVGQDCKGSQVGQQTIVRLILANSLEMNLECVDCDARAAVH